MRRRIAEFPDHLQDPHGGIPASVGVPFYYGGNTENLDNIYIYGSVFHG